MTIVQECLDALPFGAPPRLALERDEALLLGEAVPMRGAPARQYAPLSVVHLGAGYVEQKFSPPRGVYESREIRIERQNMNGRQPFYHRNCGVDELSLQVCGERTLMTELGTVELLPGDMARIPDGIAHDNFGRQDVHVLFYVPGPMQECVPSVRTSMYKPEPFPGWTPSILNELITEGVAGPGQDVVMTPVREQLLLETARHVDARIQILRPDAGCVDVQWLYHSPSVWIGRRVASCADGKRYTRHLNADEIQYQLSGERMLVTQRGAVTLVPGDFVQIPRGVAFTSIHDAG